MSVSALSVKQQFRDALFKIPGVNGVGIAPARKRLVNFNGQESFQQQPEKLNVYVEKLTLKLREQIPKVIQGVQVNVVEIGKIVAFGVDRTSRIRPAMPGISIGNVEITAGTFGAVVIDNVTGLNAILSNTHVLSSSITSPTPILEVVQPGPSDEGVLPEDLIATLTRWIILHPGLINTVDCAIALPINQEDIIPEILEVGFINGVEPAIVDMEVIKSGRTTGVTTGTVLDTNMAVSVIYQEEIIVFDDQILTTLMAEPGDSGSVLLNPQNLNALGMLVAGSNEAVIYCKMQNIINNLNITVAGVGPEAGEPDPDAPQINLVTVAMALAGIGLLTLQKKKK